MRTEREGGGCDEERPEIEGKLGLNSRDKHQFLVANGVCHVREIKSYINDGILQRPENAMRCYNSKVPPFGLAGWAEAAKQALIGAGVVDVAIKGKCGASGGGGGGSVVPGVEAQGQISLDRSESDIKSALIQGNVVIFPSLFLLHLLSSFQLKKLRDCLLACLIGGHWKVKIENWVTVWSAYLTKSI